MAHATQLRLITPFTAIMNQDIRTTYLWLVGNLALANPRSVAFFVPLITLASGGLTLNACSFNFIATGNETAMHLGIEVERIKKISYLLASFITGLSVSVRGL